MCAVPPFSINPQAAKPQASKLPLSPPQALPSRQSIGILQLVPPPCLVLIALSSLTDSISGLRAKCEKAHQSQPYDERCRREKRNDPLNGLRFTGRSPTEMRTMLASRSFIKHGTCKMQYARFSSFIAPPVPSLHFRGVDKFRHSKKSFFSSAHLSRNLTLE